MSPSLFLVGCVSAGSIAFVLTLVLTGFATRSAVPAAVSAVFAELMFWAACVAAFLGGM